MMVVEGGKGWKIGDIGKNINRIGIDEYKSLNGYVKERDIKDLYRNERKIIMKYI